MTDLCPAWNLGIAKLRAAQIVRLIRMRIAEEAVEMDVLLAIQHEAECIINDVEPDPT